MENQNVTELPDRIFEHHPLEDPDLDLVLEGEKMFGDGFLSEAKALFEKAIEQCPGNVQAWNNLAVTHMASGDGARAKSCLKQAVEIKPDFLEARYNLAEVYSVEGKWSGAVKELQTILSFRPDDLPTIRRLAQVFINMGKPDKAKMLLDNSDNVGAMKAFIDSLWLGIKFFTMAEGLSVRERLEKLMLAVLKLIDGQEGRSQIYKLVGTDSQSGREVILEGLAEHFYYQEAKELKDDTDVKRPELILTIGEHEDWKIFREALQAEMRAEGGCLGDFTQAKKVFRHDPRFQRYDLESTLKYFKANVGPCDCHVVRSVLV
ncbi:MAG: tetratricopeptide repeat protein [Deltaproteobacteria bacterium]|jgi:tetratricopeptide (TPR) repeat protein|nr:tetratricopeptide repeat protein [Deltaproteobacteria bacterium]